MLASAAASLAFSDRLGLGAGQIGQRRRAAARRGVGARSTLAERSSSRTIASPRHATPCASSTEQDRVGVVHEPRGPEEVALLLARRVVAQLVDDVVEDLAGRAIRSGVAALRSRTDGRRSREQRRGLAHERAQVVAQDRRRRRAAAGAPRTAPGPARAPAGRSSSAAGRSSFARPSRLDERRRAWRSSAPGSRPTDCGQVGPRARPIVVNTVALRVDQPAQLVVLAGRRLRQQAQVAHEPAQLARAGRPAPRSRARVPRSVGCDAFSIARRSRPRPLNALPAGVGHDREVAARVGVERGEHLVGVHVRASSSRPAARRRRSHLAGSSGRARVERRSTCRSGRSSGAAAGVAFA